MLQQNQGYMQVPKMWKDISRSIAILFFKLVCNDSSSQYKSQYYEEDPCCLWTAHVPQIIFSGIIHLTFHQIIKQRYKERKLRIEVWCRDYTYCHWPHLGSDGLFLLAPTWEGCLPRPCRGCLVVPGSTSEMQRGWQGTRISWQTLPAQSALLQGGFVATVYKKLTW